MGVYLGIALKRKKRYYIFTRRDASLSYQEALSSAGYKKVDDPNRADFLLYDLEHKSYLPVLERFSVRGKPTFIYPHSANSWYFWDGFHKEHPVSCNFVFTEDIKNAMISYGYRSRIEACGFPFSDVRPPGQPMLEKTLLYAPMHTMGAEGVDFLRAPASFDLNRKTLDRVFQLASLFKSVTVRYGKSFEASGMYDPHLKNVHFEKAALSNRSGAQSIEQHGIVIAAGTLAYISVALGKPTIFFHQRNEAPREWNATVNSYEKYRHFLDYPIQLTDMSDSEVVRFGTDFKRFEKTIKQWMDANIGDAFSANQFISVVREYV